MERNPFVSPNEGRFADLPEPPAPPETLKKVNDDFDDVYLSGLENYIAKLGEHIRNIQNDETARMQRFSKQLEKLKTKTSKRREDAEEDARQEFQQTISAIRRKRKHYRQMEREALDERRKYLESMSFQKREQDVLRSKLQRLGTLKELGTSDGGGSLVGPFTIFFLALEIGIILAYLSINFPKYWGESDESYILENLGGKNRIDNYYTFFVHMALMVFFGYGFLSSWIKKYCFSAISYSFMVAVFAFQMNFWLLGFWRNIQADEWTQIPMTLETLIESLYGAVAVLVTLGSVLGKITPLEILALSFLEILAYSFNYYICIYLLDVSDPGGGITLHLFGALFSLGVTSSLSETFRANKTLKTPDLDSSYRSDVFSLIGTLFVFVFFPSFNAALAPNGTQQRAAINTFISLLASCVFAFIVSRTFRKKYFNIRDVQNASLAGGIAMASAHSLLIVPGAALLCGAIAATAAVIGNVWLTPFLETKTEGLFTDTRNVLNLHGVSGLIAGIASVVSTGVSHHDSVYGQATDEIFKHGIPSQAGFQAAGLFVSIGLGVGLGVVAGALLFAVRKVSLGSEVPLTYTDEENFAVPNEFQRTRKLILDQ